MTRNQRPPAGWFAAVLAAIVLAPLALPLMFAFVLALFGVAAPAAWLTPAGYAWIIRRTAARSRPGCPFWPSDPPERRAGR